MMDRRDLAHQRLANQRISKPTFERPADVVDCLCAVQSQDFAGAKWALGLRMRTALDADVERAFNTGSILRTHLLRPTWHFVRPADIRWLLALTAPRIKKLMAYRHRQLELDAKTLRRTNAALEKALRDGAELTRDELRDVLRAESITSVGVERLLDPRAPRARALDRDEALAELAKRYFQSRGPATVQDLAKWSGLTVADARIGLEEVKQKLRQEVVEGRTYWLPRGSRPPASASPAAYLLSIYDEYISGYKYRSAIVEPEHGAKLVGMGNALTSVIVFDGQIVGTWKRRLKSMGMTVETNFFDRPTKAGKQAVATAARRYGRFLGLPVTLR